MRTTTLTLAAAALLLTGCGGDDEPADTTTTVASSSASPTTEELGEDHDDEEHEDHDDGHVDTACEAELAAMQGDDGQVLSASVEPELTCPEAVPVVTAVNALHPVGEAPAELRAEGFECTVEQDDPDGMRVEVFRCTDDRGTLVWARS